MSEVEQREPLSTEELEVVFVAWALAARGRSFVPTADHLPAARSMEAKGWLSSRELENGDAAYAFTAEGESVLGLHDLMRSRAAEAN